MEQSDGKMSVKDACAIYQTRFQPKVDINLHISDLNGVEQVRRYSSQLD